MIKHADIIPLIGGMTLGSEKAFGTRPDYMVSWEPFWGNDRHIVNHYEGEVPYLVLDKGDRPSHRVDVVSSTCPCAGLSMLSQGYGEHNPANAWMPKTARYVLEEMRPEVYWGENAPAFAGSIGKPIRDELYKIGRENGYSMTVYRTKSLFHGVPQVRERSFYFFWKGDKTPVLKYYREPHERIEKVIKEARGNSQRDVINPKIPSKDDPYYRFVLEKMHGGISHREFCETAPDAKARNVDVLSYIEREGITYDEVAEWMDQQGLPSVAEKCRRRHEKLAAGGSIMRRNTIVPRDYIGAFVGHYPMMLTHPVEDRYINYREAMTIMGLPSNFELLDQKKSTNHICQNVPVRTAQDMATEVREYLLGNRETVDSTFTMQYSHSQKLETHGGGSTLEAYFER